MLHANSLIMTMPTCLAGIMFAAFSSVVSCVNKQTFINTHYTSTAEAVGNVTRCAGFWS